MAVTKVLNIKVQDGELDDLNKQLDRTAGKMNRVEGATGKATSKIQEMGKNGGLIATLDRFTNGLASQMRDAAEATGAFNFSLKATRTALIATGIGAFVVALGLVVAYWDEIVEFITRANEKLQEQIDILKSQNTLLDAEFKLLDSQQKLLEAQGKSTDELIDKKKLLLQTQLGVLGAELAMLTAQNERLDNQAKELTFWEKVGDILGRTTRVGGQRAAAVGEITPEEQIAINQRQQARAELEARIAELQGTLQGLINGPGGDGEGTRGPNQGRADNALYQFGPLTGLSLVNELPEVLDTELGLLRAAENARTKSAEAEAAAREMISQREFEAKQQNLFAYADAAQAVGALLGQETASGKALAVAATLINTYAAIAGQLKAFAGVPIPGYAIAQAIATGAFGLMQVKQILAVKVPGGEGGGVSGTSPSTPPAFNVVSNSPQNQLNQALLSQNRQPIPAYVVEGEVTSAQQLRRNKISTSSL